MELQVKNPPPSGHPAWLDIANLAITLFEEIGEPLLISLLPHDTVTASASAEESPTMLTVVHNGQVLISREMAENVDMISAGEVLDAQPKDPSTVSRCKRCGAEFTDPAAYMEHIASPDVHGDGDVSASA